MRFPPISYFICILFFCFLSQLSYADSLLTFNPRFGGVTTDGQPSAVSFRGGVTDDGGKSFKTEFTADQKLDVLADILVDETHVGKVGIIFVVARYNGQWFVKNAAGEWHTWTGQLDQTLVSHSGPRILNALESLTIAQQLTGLIGQISVYVGYQLEGEQRIHYNAKPFSFSVTEAVQEPNPVVNRPPVADAGVFKKYANEWSQVILNGRNSHDPDGDSLRYFWEQTGGPRVIVPTYDQDLLLFNAPEASQATTLTFKLTVTDPQGLTDSVFTEVSIQKVLVINNYLPNPVCLSPQILQNGECVTPLINFCVTPQVLQDGVCVIPPVACTAPQVLQNGVCVTPPVACTAPEVLQNGICVTPPVACVAPEVLQNGVCVTPPVACVAPEVLQNGVCVTPPVACVAPEVLQNGVCVTPPVACVAPEVLENGICVIPVVKNQAPIANDASASLNEDSQALITLSGTDPEQSVLTYSVVTKPLHGKVSLVGMVATYIPEPNYAGVDSFTFKVNDGLVDSLPATISLTVLGQNDAPTADSSKITTDQDASKSFILSGFDVESTPTFSIVSAPQHGTATVVGNLATYIPAAGYFGIDSFSFKTSDGLLSSAAAVIDIVVIKKGSVYRLNDTGINNQQCYSAGSSILGNCTSAQVIALNPAQDGMIGRDVTANNDQDGHAGFTFIKVCNSGELAGRGTCPSDPILGSGPNDWGCTQDNVAGLIWEVKTDDAGLRDKSHKYTNFSAAYNPNGKYATGTDATGYLQAVNNLKGAERLCGATDWRLPSKRELLNIVDFSVPYAGPALDNLYFPNSGGYEFWASSDLPGINDNAFFIDFSDGLGYYDLREKTFAVRLVRTGQ